MVSGIQVFEKFGKMGDKMQEQHRLVCCLVYLDLRYRIILFYFDFGWRIYSRPSVMWTHLNYH